MLSVGKQRTNHPQPYILFPPYIFTTRTKVIYGDNIGKVINRTREMMPQLDKFTYFTQFFWLCLIFFTFYISLCRDGVPRISRILKLRNQLVPHQQRGKPRLDPNSLEEILGRGFSTGVSYMYSSLFEVSQWCDAADLLGKNKKITYISCFGEISGSRRMERNILYLIPKYSYSTYPNPISGWRITRWDNIMLMHVLHGQVNIVC
uniref:H(+)-transporting two-sector ATPase n=1 Tax=Larix sibirica TaxID=62751 RepID=A0A866K179_9CONI|nr:ATPase subunit 8 [Larix sibirica]